MYSKIIYLTLEAIKEMHTQEMEYTKGVLGIRNLEGLKSAVEQPKASFGNKELYTDVFIKAAVLSYSIAEGQVFIDGNKRIALLSALVFLEINGHTIEQEEESLYGCMINMALKKLSKEDFALILKDLCSSQK